ncbi:hypothetical protein [Azotobacter beijerinckii]|uniref:Uncharacterized protein n=1 Tax=Azotobacter beijerinckii TaxID=170623 RepID=A0A1I3ZNZ7_9GAMM|nr:hypothetical protein [Azotobacter beijerinckii]SFK45815.1 hypothetical protein SAMN04244574_00690 [Azotobacter beijerinckii]
MSTSATQPYAWLGAAGTYRSKLDGIANGEQLLTPLYLNPAHETELLEVVQAMCRTFDIGGVEPETGSLNPLRALHARGIAALDGRQPAQDRDSFCQRLRALAEQIEALGADIDYFGGFGMASQYGRNLVGTARLARDMAQAIEMEGQP